MSHNYRLDLMVFIIDLLNVINVQKQFFWQNQLKKNVGHVLDLFLDILTIEDHSYNVDIYHR